MSDNLKLDGIAAVVMVGDKQVTVDQSTDLSSLDAKTMKALKDANALVSAEQGAPEQIDLRERAVTTVTPGSTVLQIAAYIESGGDDGKPLNAAQTVELAGGDADVAKKVLEAESLAHGGDPRSTVTGPLEKIAKDAEGSGS